jgi:hypothetical protein
LAPLLTSSRSNSTSGDRPGGEQAGEVEGGAGEILLALSMFWNTERLARVMGEGYADQISSNPRQLLAVTVYSPKSLEIDVHGVVETKLGTAESAYRYRYDGLRLVQRSGDRYLLMSERWDAGSSRIIVLRDSDAIRLEFAR